MSGVAITTTGDYGVGDGIDVTVTFSEDVTVDTTGGTPQITLTVGTTTRSTTTVSGSGGTALVFTYTVAAGDSAPGGVSIAANTLALNSGAIQDAAGNDATLTHVEVPVAGDQVVDTAAPAAPAVSTVAITSTGPYALNEVIEVTVTFSEEVTVDTAGGTPQIPLVVGTTPRQAVYTSGSTTAALVFTYTVVAGETDADGVSIVENTLAGNSGTIRNSGGTDADLAHPAVDPLAANAVDTTAPAVSGVAITTTGDYGVGDGIDVTVTFSEDVTVDTTGGTPQITLTVGTTTRSTTTVSGSGGTALVFTYTVAAGDSAPGGVSIAANTLALNSGAIQDAAGNDATLTHVEVPVAGDQVVDTAAPAAPAVSTVAITSTGPYALNEVIEVTVTFSEEVTVDTAGGTPQIPLVVGTTPRQAVYTSGSTTAALVFTYTVVAGETDADGVSIVENTLAGNSGTIRNSGGTDADLAHPAVDPLAANAVDTTAPAVSGVAITTTGDYGVGDGIDVTVTFSEDVTVDTTGGTPQITLTVGTTTRSTTTVSGSGGTALVFTYTVAAGDSAPGGVSIAANTLALNSGAIQDAAGNDATLTHGEVPVAGDQVVDTAAPAAPAVSTVAITSTGPYALNEVIEVTVTFSEEVTVDTAGGTPQIPLVVGTTPRQAVYTSGSTTAALVFTYTVVAGETDADGVSIVENTLAGNSGTIRNSGGTDADLAHPAVDPLAANAVDTTAPAVSGVAITTTGDYGVGDGIDVTVTFSEDVTVDTTGGTPQITLTVGTTTRSTTTVSGSGGTALVFTYTVAAGDSAPGGVSIAANTLALNSGAIQDAAGNDATLTHVEVPVAGDQVVDTAAPAAPAVSTVAITSTGPYALNEVIEVTVTFSEEVTVDTAGGTPQIPLVVGTTPRQAVYTSGSTTAALVFTYTVVAGETDADGVSIVENTLAGNSGTIRNSGGTAANLDHPAVDPDTANAVDTTAPAVDTVEISTTGPYGLGDNIEVTVTFGEDVTVDTTGGTPQITLMVDSTTRSTTAVSGSGNTALVFTYTVAAGENDTDGVSIVANTLALNGGTIQDAAGNDAALAHGEVAAAVDQVVDTTAPTVSMVDITSTGSPYGVDGVIDVTVTFSEAVTVSGTPQIALTVGTTTRQTTYISGTGTAALVFTYTVVVGDNDDDGVSIAADALAQAGSSTIRDAAGNDAALAHGEVAAVRDEHVVDSTMPSDPSARVIAPVPLTESNLNGATLEVRLTGTEYVGESELDEDDFTLSPPGVEGVTVGSVTRDSTTTATLMLAYNETPIDVDDSMLGVMVLDVGHTGSDDLDAGAVPIINEPTSSDATLADLMVFDNAMPPGARALKPAFDPTVTDYTIRVERAVPFVLVRPVTTHRRAGFTLDVDTLIDQLEQINLNPDVPRMVTINVTAEDGSSTGTYSVTLTRLLSAPVLESLSVNGDTLTLRYSRALDTGSQPSTTDFTVQADGGTVNIDSVVVAGAAVTLTLATAVTDDQTVTLSYIPGANPVRDSIDRRTAIQLVPGDEPVTTLTDEMVTNGTPPPAVAPVFDRATVRGADGSMGPFGEFDLVFNAPLRDQRFPDTSAFTIDGMTVLEVEDISNTTEEGTVTLLFFGFIPGGVEYSITYTPLPPSSSPPTGPLAGQDPGNPLEAGALVEGFTITARSL